MSKRVYLVHLPLYLRIWTLGMTQLTTMKCLEETSSSFQVISRQFIFKLPEPSSGLTRYSQGLFAACRSSVSAVEK